MSAAVGDGDGGGADADAYDVLGLTEAATEADVRRAFHAASRRLHSDLNPDADPAAFPRAVDARNELLDPALRSALDLRRAARRVLRERVARQSDARRASREVLLAREARARAATASAARAPSTTDRVRERLAALERAAAVGAARPSAPATMADAPAALGGGWGGTSGLLRLERLEAGVLTELRTQGATCDDVPVDRP